MHTSTDSSQQEQLREVQTCSLSYTLCFFNMSSCDNCDCADKSQCVKKGNSYGIEIIGTEKSYVDNVVDTPAAAEHDGNCKCGAACACDDCKCGK